MTNTSIQDNSFLYNSSLAPISRDEEQELAVKMSKGDKKARETLIRANIRFAIREASKYKGLNLDYEELVSIAVSGLINGINHFDAGKNIRIITYASWWIRAEFKSVIEKKSKTKEYGVSEHFGSEAIENLISSQADEKSMTPEENAIQACWEEDFYKNVKELPEQERKIFLMHQGLGGYSKLSYSEIGEKFGKTKQWAYQKAQTAENFMAKKLSCWLAA